MDEGVPISSKYTSIGITVLTAMQHGMLCPFFLEPNAHQYVSNIAIRGTPLFVGLDTLSGLWYVALQYHRIVSTLLLKKPYSSDIQ